MVAATPPYREQAHIFFKQAQDEFVAGDLLQASEKGWGAAAQMVKAVAAGRGWDHRTHRDLNRAVARLEDMQLNNDFGLAQSLHQNFYEGWLERSQVEQYLSAVGAFLERLTPHADDQHA